MIIVMRKIPFLRQKDDTFIFKHSSFFLRTFNFCIAVFIFISNILGIKENSYSLVAIGVGIFCLLISCYQNLWIFQLDKKIILNKKGVFFLSRKQTFTFSEVSAILIEKYMRSAGKAEYTEISVQFKDGETQVIESEKTKKIKDKIEMAEELQRLIH